MPRRQECIKYLLQGRPGFEGLARRQHDTQYLITGQRLTQIVQVQRRYGIVGDDTDLLAADVPSQELRLRQQMAAYVNGVTALTQFNAQLLHQSLSDTTPARIQQPHNLCLAGMLAHVWNGVPV